VLEYEGREISLKAAAARVLTRRLRERVAAGLIECEPQLQRLDDENASHRCVAAVLTLLLCAPAGQQTVQGGIKGGVSVSSWTGSRGIGDCGVDTSTRINWMAGVFVR